MSGTGVSSPRVALVSVGLGRIRRGFERYFSELFNELKGQVDITLYKSAGESGPREQVPPWLGLAQAAVKLLPLGDHVGGPQYKSDCAAMGLGLLPTILHERFDIVHCIDPPLASVLLRLRKITGFRSRLLFTEGCATPPAFYPAVTHIHQVAAVPLQVAIEHGVPPSFLTHIPCGMHSARFTERLNRTELRRKYGIAETTFVALAVSAVQRTFKRVDYIIEELSQVPGDVLLWIDGNPEDRTLFDLAKGKLGERCRITHVPSSDVHEIYQTADVLVHASLDEAFGLAVVEALCSGLPVIAHDSPHFDWLTGSRDWLGDMREPGRMAKLVEKARALDPESLREIGERGSAATARRFDWRVVAPDYIDLYRRVAAMEGQST